DAFRTTQYFQLVSTDDGAVVPTTATAELGPQGTYIIRVAAPVPPAGQFRLKSRTTYRFVVAAGITDTGGHPMKASLGTVFTTVDYTKPSIVAIEPAVGTALPSGVTFRVHYNKALGAAGTVRFEQLNQPGGGVVDTIGTSVTIDPVDASVMSIAPHKAIVESSAYRLTINGARDAKSVPNTQTDERVFEWVSF